ncbi:unnamed protein product [Candidula unifasciata]|uniref:Periodic tryptophan protein 1 homolog n=1 Tax=Candidula unifasciata TaxID=100452 RepID=A0A8S3ZQW3_9EUPU|nr:unnamed protein product [Candidula unifasciata]
MAGSGGKKNIVPCLVWVQQGCAKQNPDKVSLNKEELQKIIQKTQNELDDKADESEEENARDLDGNTQDSEDEFESAMRKAENMAASIKHKKAKQTVKRKHIDENDEQEDDIVKKYGLDDYDNEDLRKSSSFDFYHPREQRPSANSCHIILSFADPYITLKDDIDSDDEDFVLKPTDNLLAIGKVTEEAAVLEVHIYNEEMNNLFIHHDYILPTIPLVLEWLDYDIADGQKGNFVAMGTMEPDIGIWDLDVVDSLEPVAVLAGTKHSKKKKLKKKDALVDGHTDSVLDLSWNKNVRNVLASASADHTVCLWDLAEGKVVSSLKHHEKEVQCVSWHPVESQSLLTGSFDNFAAVVDCRSPKENVKKWEFDGEVERCIWNHFCPFNFLVSTDKGLLYEVDVRHSKPLFTLSAHEQAVTGISLSSQIPGLLVTTSPDKHLKVWDIQDSKPSLVLSRNLKLDVLHCVASNPDHPFVFAVGANRDFKVWDIRESAAVRRHFLTRMPAPMAAECAEDAEDLPGDAAADAMENLNMEDEEDAAEEEEMLAGDRGESKTSKLAQGGDKTGKKKKKKKKKKKVPAAKGE